jgi:hypothetical protein
MQMLIHYYVDADGVGDADFIAIAYHDHYDTTIMMTMMTMTLKVPIMVMPLC